MKHSSPNDFSLEKVLLRVSASSPIPSKPPDVSKNITNTFDQNIFAATFALWHYT